MSRCDTCGEDMATPTYVDGQGGGFCSLKCYNLQEEASGVGNYEDYQDS